MGCGRQSGCLRKLYLKNRNGPSEARQGLTGKTLSDFRLADARLRGRAMILPHYPPETYEKVLTEDEYHAIKSFYGLGDAPPMTYGGWIDDLIGAIRKLTSDQIDALEQHRREQLK